jgi:hypothetical protein
VKYVNAASNQQQLVCSNIHEEALLIDEEIIRNLNNDDMCNVYRNELENDQKSRSFGFLVTFLSCGIVIGFTESIKAEGCRRVTVKFLFMTFRLFMSVFKSSNKF